jgi:hypothetical protein
MIDGLAKSALQRIHRVARANRLPIRGDDQLLTRARSRSVLEVRTFRRRSARFHAPDPGNTVIATSP